MPKEQIENIKHFKEGMEKRILAIIVVSIITASLVGGLVYFSLAQVTSAQKTYINQLENQTDYLSDKLKELSKDESG